MKIIGITSVSLSKNKRVLNQLKKKFKGEIKTVKKRLDPKDLQNFLIDCDYAIIGLDKIDKQLIDNCKKLKAISKYGVGLDNIDIEYCKKQKIRILNSKGTNKLSVAEMTVGFAITLIRNMHLQSINLRNGKWITNGGSNLSGKKFGILGYGNVGREIVRLLRPFQCKIYCNDIKKFSDTPNIKFRSKNYIFQNCDIVSINLPLTKLTYKCINREKFSKIRKNIILINTSRGDILDETDLIRYTRKNKILSCGLDVFSKEPLLKSKLFNFNNFFTTPHIGGSSKESIDALSHAAINNLIKII